MSLPTVDDYRDSHRVEAYCVRCNEARPLDLDALSAAGKGAVPLIHLPLRCSACGHGNCGVIVFGRAHPFGAPVP